MRGPATGLLLVVAGAACTGPEPQTAQTARPIVNGEATEGDPSVVALIRGGPFCTGTLISPRHVLTAGHCGQGLQAGTFQVFFGSDPNGDGVTIDGIDVRVHPDFKINPLTNDVSVILLAEPAPAEIAPSPMLTVPFDDSFNGRAIRLVGFGSTTEVPEPPPAKRQGITTIESFTDVDFRFTLSPSSTCRGDSGGPAFVDVDGIEYIAGTTTAGDPACAEFGRDTRTDAYVADFIQPYVDQTSEGAAGPGERCFYSEQCSEGTCTPASDDSRLSFCATECADTADCADGQECIADDDGLLCQWPEPTPGTFGAACTDGTECLDRLCAGKTGDESDNLICTRPCSSEAPMPCPDGFECKPSDALGEGGRACFPEGPGGCSVGGSAAAGQGIALAAIAIALGRRRRRRVATTSRAAATR